MSESRRVAALYGGAPRTTVPPPTLVYRLHQRDRVTLDDLRALVEIAGQAEMPGDSILSTWPGRPWLDELRLTEPVAPRDTSDHLLPTRTWIVDLDGGM